MWSTTGVMLEAVARAVTDEEHVESMQQVVQTLAYLFGFVWLAVFGAAPLHRVCPRVSPRSSPEACLLPLGLLSHTVSKRHPPIDGV